MIFKIFSLLGTPTKETWPRLSSYPDLVSPRWPHYTKKDMRTEFTTLDEDELDLIQRMLRYEKRLPMKDALKHPYLSEK